MYSRRQFWKGCGDSNYPYAIGGYYNGEPVAEPDLTIEEIPAHTYAVFRCEGKNAGGVYQAVPSGKQ